MLIGLDKIVGLKKHKSLHPFRQGRRLDALRGTTLVR
jgi:hypothetical protein